MCDCLKDGGWGGREGVKLGEGRDRGGGLYVKF
jgi:hypothetical protein